MGFRVRRRIKIAPGFSLNLSRSGVSASIGRRGATVNLSSKGSRATVGLPGTGVSYRTRQLGGTAHPHPAHGKPAPAGAGTTLLGAVVFVGTIAALVHFLL